MTTDQLDIIYEDNHLIVINKQPGQIVQSDKTNDICMSEIIKTFIKQRDAKTGNVYCGVIHRLDRPVSGLVVFAKTSKALARMNELVKNRDFHKTYWTITKEAPQPPEGRLENWMIRNEKNNKSYIVPADTPNAKLAILDYRELATSKGGYHLIEVTLHTGRHHQIRLQLSHLGCPIKGDLKYGYNRSNSDMSISLHARHIEFVHPVSHQTLSLYAPPPEEFQKMFPQCI